MTASHAARRCTRGLLGGVPCAAIAMWLASSMATHAQSAAVQPQAPVPKAAATHAQAKATATHPPPPAAISQPTRAGSHASPAAATAPLPASVSATPGSNTAASATAPAAASTPAPAPPPPSQPVAKPGDEAVIHDLEFVMLLEMLKDYELLDDAP